MRGAQGFQTMDGGEIQWVWSRPEGIYTRSGFVARALERHQIKGAVVAPAA